ncbi:hypothetical protein [Miltoncostaea marina]|uniref:hypothetical protein n=1 Tax=Miltoncostaea marina TaxID=2843215 RepID=UPI001C3DCE85|nr:hypothetical protein [Miltoncostaea marina]
MEFLDYMVKSGYAPVGAMNAWKSATKQVFVKVEGEDFGTVDVRSFDPDEYLDRFETIVMGRYKRESLDAYRVRFRKAIGAYREYLADPKNWKRPTFRASSRQRRVANSDSPATPATSAATRTSNGTSAKVESDQGLIDYPFPLRSGQMAQLRLPARLDKTDAERLGAFLRTLSFEPQGQLPSSTSDDEGSDE